MELAEKAEEILETLWIRTQEGKEDLLSLDDLGITDIERSIEQLLQAGYIVLSNSQVQLTGRGYPEAENVVRRHRLAERLLVDVLDTKGMLVHEKACKFEHLLGRGLDESICTLLGHPRICPHGKPIPPGECCREGQRRVQKLVSPLAELASGQKGKIAYIYAPESSKLQKLINMGILPGASICLIQSFPSYVFQIGQAQFAIDKEIADAIYVRLMEAESHSETAPQKRRKPLWQRLRGGNTKL